MSKGKGKRKREGLSPARLDELDLLAVQVTMATDRLVAETWAARDALAADIARLAVEVADLRAAIRAERAARLQSPD